MKPHDIQKKEKEKRDNALPALTRCKENINPHNICVIICTYDHTTLKKKKRDLHDIQTYKKNPQRILQKAHLTAQNQAVGGPGGVRKQSRGRGSQGTSKSYQVKSNSHTQSTPHNFHLTFHSKIKIKKRQKKNHKIPQNVRKPAERPGPSRKSGDCSRKIQKNYNRYLFSNFRNARTHARSLAIASKTQRKNRPGFWSNPSINQSFLPL